MAAGSARVAGVEAQALSALLNLGYRRADAERSVSAAHSAGEGELEAVIRGALKRLSS